MSEFTPLIRFSREQDAQLLAAYLRNQAIDCIVTPVEVQEQVPPQAQRTDTRSAFQLKLANDSDKAQATKIAEEFLNNPRAEKFQQAAWQTGDIASTSQSMFGKGLPSLHEIGKSPFTVIVLLICVCVYLTSIIGYFDFWYQSLQIQYFAELAENHQWWRLFGPNFLHFSATHIIFNLVWWWIFGSQLERVFGTFWVVILFVVASLFANISQLLVSGPNFGGMSGVVYALFGFVWWIGWLRPKWGIGIPNGFVVFLLLWLVLGYTDILGVDMANQAHTFGLISGCLLAISLHLVVSKPK